MWEDVYVSWQKERPRKNQRNVPEKITKMDLTNSVSACQGDCRKIGGVKEKADVQTSAFFD